MSEALNIPSLLRQVRKAVLKENYEEAVGLYELIVQDPEMAELLDTKTRYAFCVEKTGNMPKAIELYQEIVEIYKGSGESGAAKALELKISILKSLAENKKPSKANLDKSEASIQNFEEASLAFMHYLNLSDDDLEPGAKASLPTHDTAHDFMEFLALGTQDFSPEEDEPEKTQEIPSMDKKGKEENTQDLDNQESNQKEPAPIEASPSGDIRETSSGTEDIDEDDILDAVATAISGASSAEIKAQVNEPSKAAKKTKAKKVSKKTKPTKKAKETKEEEPNEELSELKEMIRAGIKGNRVKSTRDPSIEVALTSIGEHKLELADPDEVYVATKPKEKKMDATLAQKAEKLFGHTKGKQ